MKRVIAIGLAIFCLSLWHNLSHVPTTVFHRDEARWVGRAFFVNEAFRPFDSTWDDGYLTRGQPPLGSYLMGLGLTLQGKHTTTTTDRQLYDFQYNQEWNRERGLIPVWSDIEAGRRTNAVVGALTVLLVFLIGWRLTNLVGGVVGALLLLPHPLHVYLSSLAGSDALLGFFVALAAWLALGFSRRVTWRRTLALGVVLGLGAATKLSPLPLAVGLALIGALFLAIHRLRRPPTAEDHIRAELGWRFISLPLIAFATFVAVYPYLWRNPIRYSLNLFTFRSDEMVSQGSIWDDRHVSGLPVAFGRVRLHLGERLTTSGWLSDHVASVTGWGWNLPGIDLALGMMGLALLLVMVATHGLSSKYALVAMVLLGQTAITLLGLRVDFERYYLPILITLAVGVGFLAGQLWVVMPLLIGWFRNTTSTSRPRPTTADRFPHGN